MLFNSGKTEHFPYKFRNSSKEKHFNNWLHSAEKAGDCQIHKVDWYIQSRLRAYTNQIFTTVVKQLSLLNVAIATCYCMLENQETSHNLNFRVTIIEDGFNVTEQ